MKKKDVIVLAVCAAAITGIFGTDNAMCAGDEGYYLNGPVYVPPQTLPNYEGAGRTMILPNREDVGSGSGEYYDNRERALESASIVESEEDSRRILEHFERNGIMDAEGLREAGVSEEGYGQLMDDAKLGY